ncbi:ABC transporter ATP-binding protein/permease [Acidobacteria bacterium AH-259-A15]|nr:ABC transporter ATP-binding protein/permease [Acidobacteria bacterium AH-259-A15]
MTDFRKLFPYIRPNLHLLIFALFLLVLSGALETLVIMLLGPIFDQLSTTAGVGATGNGKFAFLQHYLGLDQNSLGKIAFFLVAFSFSKGVFLYLAEYSMSYSGQQVVAALRKQLYRHLLDHSLSFYAENPTGKLMARVITDTERLQETVSKTLTDFMRQVLLLVFFLGLVFYTDWKLALLSFLIAPVVLSVTVKLGRKMRTVSWRSQENLSEISHVLQESITGQRIVKAFGMEEYERKRFDHSTDRLVGVNLRATRISALTSPLVEFIGYISFVPFLLYANHQINRGFTIGAFVVFVAALFRLYDPVRKLSRMHLYFQQAFASSNRIFELLETDVEIKDPPEAKDLSPIRTEIALEKVSFSYDSYSSNPALHDVDLRIKKGEIVALVGSSGAGKSSLASLIPRFYDVTSGRITIDGTDIREVSLRSVRGQIAIVTQDTFLFNDTIKDNIAYGREDCTMEEIVEAARAAFIHGFIQSLAQGYETFIGERGQRLSGGQRQRIAIARAILKNAPILILDEATSALDSESERLIQEALYSLMRHCTTLVIAHRLSTVRVADRIVVLKEGRIVEIGDHHSLLDRSGVYRKLYDLQFSDAGFVPSQEMGTR